MCTFCNFLHPEFMMTGEGKIQTRAKKCICPLSLVFRVDNAERSWRSFCSTVYKKFHLLWQLYQLLQTLLKNISDISMHQYLALCVSVCMISCWIVFRKKKNQSNSRRNFCSHSGGNFCRKKIIVRGFFSPVLRFFLVSTTSPLLHLSVAPYILSH